MKFRKRMSDQFKINGLTIKIEGSRQDYFTVSEFIKKDASELKSGSARIMQAPFRILRKGFPNFPRRAVRSLSPLADLGNPG
jgi:hypothetical protein